MSNQPTQVLHGVGEPMEIESSTYTCPHCQCDILQSNQDTHEARCARMNRDQPQRPAQSSVKQQSQQQVGRQEQREAGGLRITKEHSSSSIPYPDEPTANMRQPQIRREARRVAENKLMTCANCEKSIREDDMVNHQRYECQGSDKIPCEFCDRQVSMTEYQNHVDNCPKRQEEAQQERARSLERQRQDEENLRQIQQDQRRVNSAERRPGPSVNTQAQGQEQHEEGHGFMNFLKNLATAALQNRSDVEDSTQPQPQRQAETQNQQRQQQRQQRQQEQQRQEQQRQEQQRQQQQRQEQQRQQQAQAHQPSFLARLLGFHPETPEEAEQRRQRHQERQEQIRRAEMQRRQQQQQMLQDLFEPRGMMGNMMMGGPQSQGNAGNVRTIRFGPHGSVIISSSNRGPQQTPPVGYQPGQRREMEHDMEEMGPLGVLLSMMNGGIPGMNVISPEELEGMSREEQAGLAREVLDSLSVVKYDPEKNKNVSEDLKSCPVCIEEFAEGDEVRYLWCMHRFHKGCIDKWFEAHTNCPICKKEFSEDQVSFE